MWWLFFLLIVIVAVLAWLTVKNIREQGWDKTKALLVALLAAVAAAVGGIWEAFQPLF